MPDPYDRLVFPDLEFGMRSGRETFLRDLVDAFPAEAAAIRRWLRDAERAASFAAVLSMRGSAPPAISRAAEALLFARGRLARTTTRAYLEERFRDPRLRAVLGARWADHGLPPGESAFLGHAIIATHYLDGAFYPVGSGARIADTATRVVEAAGGEVRVRAEVERILVEDGRAAGVALRGGETIRAPVVVSDAGARNTYLRLLPDDVPLPFRDELRRIPTGMATASLYLGLSRSPEALGVRGENFWIHEGLDQDALWARRGETLRGRPPVVYLSFPSMKDPQARAHTAEVVTALDLSGFARWEGTAWKRRGEEYEGLKDRIAEGMLRAVERRLPGFSGLVVHRELSTPLTTRGFTAHPGGEIYGVPLTPERLGLRWLSARTPVRGLYLTGADALVLGVYGAAMAGLTAAAAVAGPGMFRRVREEGARLARRRRAATGTEPSPSTA
jgi:phytoene dehydrogenase-like protein